jgi:hypothetical protein
MKKLVTAVLAALAALTAGAVAFAEQAFVSAKGEYVWNLAASKYESPPYAKSQTMSIVFDDGKAIKLSQDVTLADGKRFTWAFDGAFDGKPHPGEWITVALKRVAPNAFSNDYSMNDGTKGHEVVTITANQIVIRGSSVTPAGHKDTYVEVWDRVQ